MIIDTTKLDVGTALSITRTMLGITQKELASMLAIPLSSLSKAETGIRELPETYMAVAWDWIEGANS